MSDQPTVALLGTGIMGVGMGRNIAAAGMPLRVWNRTREKAEPVADAGATLTDSPADAVRDCDVVITMLFDADSVESTLREAADELREGAVLLQMSTVGVEGAERLAQVASELGLVYVDAPVLGTKKPAEDGALVVLASGPEGMRDRIAPVLDAISSRTVWAGDAGQGSRLKLVANSWVLTVLEGIAEALTFTKALGLEPEQFLEAVKGGAMDAPYVQLKGNAMLNGAFDPAFALDGALKDVGLIQDAARAAGADLPIAEAARHYLQAASDAGHGDEDMAAIYLAH
jgi:3-hydroxyisobutyrate dehydrogenase